MDGGPDILAFFHHVGWRCLRVRKRSKLILQTCLDHLKINIPFVIKIDFNTLIKIQPPPTFVIEMKHEIPDVSSHFV